MARILLVDDESLTTDTLQALILNEIPDQEVFCAHSSLQAMEILEQYVFDVVVTDIAMPRMSGLELVEHIRKNLPMCYVIVLTAYSSFEYAYQASQYEDVRFILKIEPPEVIMDAVRAGLDKMRRYYNVSPDDRRIRQYLADTSPLLRQTLIERLLLYGEPLPEAPVSEGCGINIQPGKDTRIAVTGIVTPREKQREICGLILSMLRNSGVRADEWYTENRLVFLMQKDDWPADLPVIVKRQLDRIIEGAGNETGLSFILSSVPVAWEKLGDAVFALTGYARRALKSNQIIQADPFAEQKRSISIYDILRWRKCMEQRDLAGLTDAVRENIRREGWPQGRSDCAGLLWLLYREYFGEQRLEAIHTGSGTAEAILWHMNYASAEEWLEQISLLTEVLFSGSIREKTETDEILGRVNRYIQEHLAEPISLTGIADHFNYNSSYLSRMYKQNMNEGISEHIIRMRIEAACHLLAGSGKSIGDIAELCGFQTTKYFITVFKRLKGMTPKSWRDSV